MPRAIRSTRSGTFAVAALPPFGDGVATVRQAVHDGDTVNVAPEGDFAIRFLGVDTAERSFDFPLRAGEAPRANPRFVSLSDADWETFLANPFSSDWRPFTTPLDSALQADLANRAGAGAAANHDFWARAGERFLEDEIERDRTNRGLVNADFRFFLAFAFEVMDGYGRLLCFLNVNEPDRARRPEDYNLRALRAGLALPYFIWPNIDPFLRTGSVTGAAGAPRPLRQAIADSRSLRIAGGPCRANRGWRALWRGEPASAHAVRAAVSGTAQPAGPLGDRPLCRRRPAAPAAGLYPHPEPRGPTVPADGVRCAIRRERLAPGLMRGHNCCNRGARRGAGGQVA
ncbi:MAG: hypothetical protein ACXW3S_09805 [Rhodoplanes sp.]